MTTGTDADTALLLFSVTTITSQFTFSQQSYLLGDIREKQQAHSLAFHPFEVNKLSNSCNRMFASSHEWRRLVNAYGVKAWCSSTFPTHSA